MKNILKNLGLTIIAITISFFVFMTFLETTAYPGGAVGMVPLLILYSAAISLIPTIIIMGLVKIKRDLRTSETLLIFLLSYIFISYFYIGVRPFDNDQSKMDKT